MSDKTLTPRVGDRVVFKADGAVTDIGTVLGFPEVQVGPDEHHRMVEVLPTRAVFVVHIYEHDLQVVDREPVEWPEGWERYRGDNGVIFNFNGRSWAFERDDLAAVLATGPEMLEKFDELVGGEG